MTDLSKLGAQFRLGFHEASPYYPEPVTNRRLLEDDVQSSNSALLLTNFEHHSYSGSSRNRNRNRNQMSRHPMTTFGGADARPIHSYRPANYTLVSFTFFSASSTKFWSFGKGWSGNQKTIQEQHKLRNSNIRLIDIQLSTQGSSSNQKWSGMVLNNGRIWAGVLLDRYHPST